MKRLVLTALFAVLASSSLGCMCCRPACGDVCAEPVCETDCGESCGHSGGGCDWGCGEKYWGDWFEQRSPCYESCDQCANWTGAFNHPGMSVGHAPGDTGGQETTVRSGEPTPVPPPPKSTQRGHGTSR